MLSKIANMKQKMNNPPGVNPIDYSPKDVYIKKEPTDDSMDACNQNSNEPQDLKVKIEIKTEIKPNVTENPQPEMEQKFEPQTFEGHIKFNSNEMKYPSEMDMKYNEPNQDSQGSNSNSQSQFHSPHPSQNVSPLAPNQVPPHPGMHAQNLISGHPWTSSFNASIDSCSVSINVELPSDYTKFMCSNIEFFLYASSG